MHGRGNSTLPPMSRGGGWVEAEYGRLLSAGGQLVKELPGGRPLNFGEGSSCSSRCWSSIFSNFPKSKGVEASWVSLDKTSGCVDQIMAVTPIPALHGFDAVILATGLPP